MGWNKREITTYVVRLEELAETIRQNHAEAFKNLKLAVVHAIAAGEALIEAKKRLKHGQWLPWLQANSELSERTAQGYMRLAKLPVEKRTSVADLRLRDALAAISDKRLPHRCAGDDYRPHGDDCELAKLEPYVAVCCGKPVRRLCACGEAPYVAHVLKHHAAVERLSRPQTFVFNRISP